MTDPISEAPRPAEAQFSLASAFNAGRASYFYEDLTAAEAAFRRALAIAPEAHDLRIALGMTLLKQGRLAEGFPLFDAWREHPNQKDNAAPELPFPLWRGEDVAGKRFLIWSESSHADQVLFARFARVLRARGALISWLCPPQLSRLFARGLGIHAIAADRPVELSDFDFYCPSSALPLGFGLELESLPAEPYISLPAPATPPPGGIAVVTDAGGANLPQDVVEQLLALPAAARFVPGGEADRDLYDTAARLAGFDLVISSDNVLAHIAGAMGRPVWILTPFPADWRWLKARMDSPWFPPARLFRQGPSGGWSPVLDDVVAALERRKAAQA